MRKVYYVGMMNTARRDFVKKWDLEGRRKEGVEGNQGDQANV